MTLMSLTFQVSLSADENAYQFEGLHFLASYLECDQERLSDNDTLREVLKQAALESGATILATSDYSFTPQGFTMVLLLSESHASIHSYPEYGACFVDLFTCGTNCSSEKFDKVLQEYLLPKRVGSELLIRNEGIIFIKNREILTTTNESSL